MSIAKSLTQNEVEKIKQLKTALIRQFEEKYITFLRVSSENDYQKVLKLRLDVYGNTVQYMLKQIDATGSDEYDKEAYIYAACLNDKVIASTRLRPLPFETTRFLSSDRLKQFLGDETCTHYLEWSRLLFDTNNNVPGITRALTIYAGLDILEHTHYTHYFGYTRPIVRRLFSKFEIHSDTLSFTIPERGEHEYHLLKGSFINDFYKYDRLIEINETI